MMVRYILLVFCIITCGVSQNLLQNPGFEAWSGGMPDYWLKDDSIAISQEAVLIHGGTVSVRESLFTQTQDDADFFQRIPVQPNTHYTYNIWVYDNDDAGRVRQAIYWVPTGSDWSGGYSEDSAGWQLLEWTVTSPASAESADVLIRAYDVLANWDGDAVFYLDDAYFAPAVGIFEDSISSMNVHLVRSPVISGISCVSVIDDRTLYPITVYNVQGRIVKTVLTPRTQLDLPAGIYMLKLNNSDNDCTKIIVVK
jgi:hypothetical protein